MKTIETDIAILGGGIVGLWALNRLRKLGYSAILLETNALGGGQTIRSQGIIHGGLKYSLTGFLTPSADSIEAMPKRWKECLQGQGEIDLRAVNILSHHQLLFSTGGLAAEITGFFASKALQSRVQKLNKTQYPAILQNAAFKGHVYELDEIVLDVPSLIKILSEPVADSILKVDEKNLHLEFSDSDNVEQLWFQNSASDERINIKAKRYVFAAGEGNEKFCNGYNKSPHIPPLEKGGLMQRRPLQMVMVKLKQDYPLYGHWMDASANPRMTITTHRTEAGELVWYLGGQIAESGIDRNQSDQIACAKKELSALFPWLDLRDSEWATFFINRAEAKQPNGKRPESYSIQSIGNTFMAWPTKLALTPLLVDKLIGYLNAQNILPENPMSSVINLSGLKRPAIAVPVWDLLFEKSIA